ncbi:glycosyltransferase family 4 protein [Comamonas serinivorans]|nr:glycosyltransferase family 1 protein [Comamonas serinivorans]
MIYLNATNSFQTRAKTGIQRVVRELGRRLQGHDDCALVVLHDGAFHALDAHELPAFLAGQAFQPARRLGLEALGAGDLFVDLDASWGDACYLEPLWRQLKRQGCTLVKMHYDAVPLLFPQYSHDNTVYRYAENFALALRYADHWICNSRAVEQDLHRIAERLDLGGVISHVCPLGADIPMAGDAQAPAPFSGGPPPRFILTVGTIEPRKNHDLVLDTFDTLLRDAALADVHLVVVGKSGWNNQHTIDRIRQHPELDRRLHWLSAASDAELAWLYQRASVCLCLSHYEGFGLPVIEALARGVPVICTEDSAMEEVAQGAAIAVPLQQGAVVDALTRFFREGTPRVPATYQPPTWDDAAARLLDIFATLRAPRGLHTPPHQAVYLSIRPEALLRSLRSVQAHMPFIDEAVVLTSDACAPRLRQLTQAMALKTTVLTEGELGLQQLPDDHQARNTLLRRRLYSQALIDDNFIAFDDDYRVIQPVDVSVFLSNQRHKAYWFQRDGTAWLGAFPHPTSFDIGLWKTVDFLQGCGFDTRLYNAHQPQLINKHLALQVFQRTQGLGCDEWSCYFNMAKHLHPGSFQDEPYVAGGWPANFESWLPSQAPEPVLFFNDLTDDQPADETVQAWRTGLAAAFARRDAIQPGPPSLVVADGSARFTEPMVSCLPGQSLFIPLLSDCDIEGLQVRFLTHLARFADPVPTFLHVAVPSDRPGRSFTVQARAACAGHELAASFEVHVREHA